jgi:hypothetical protein
MKSVSIIAAGNSQFWYFRDFNKHYKRPTDHVWAINDVGVHLHDVDCIIAMDNFRRDIKEHEQYVLNIVNRGVPVITDVADSEWPCTTPYPLRKVLDNIWPDAKDVQDISPPLYNTCNYALALALTEGYEEIRLYGCNFAGSDSLWTLHQEKMANPDKPFWWMFHMKSVLRKRADGEPGGPTMHFLLGVAHERKVKVFIPPNDSLAEMDRIAAFPHFYGYEEQPEPYEKSPEIQKLEELGEQYDQAVKAYNATL